MAGFSGPLSLTLGMIALAVLTWACAPPPAPPRQEEPADVVRAFLEAQRTGKATEAAARWGFATAAFQSVGGAPAEAAIRADIRRKADSRLPREFAVGATEFSPQDRDRAFVQAWLDRPQSGPASLYELARTQDGWQIVGYAAAPTPPLRQP